MSVINANTASVKWNGKTIKAALYGLVRASWSDGSAVVNGEDGLSYRVPNDVVAAAGLYGALKPGRRVRFDVGDGEAADTATSIALA